ncbi:MAG: hypothetical protein ACLP36_02195 [Acidimicrobiales bacterium]
MVRELIARRELPVVRIGRLVRLGNDDLDAYVQACRQPASRGPLRDDANLVRKRDTQIETRKKLNNGVSHRGALHRSNR